jgi:hypothetical protein
MQRIKSQATDQRPTFEAIPNATSRRYSAWRITRRCIAGSPLPRRLRFRNRHLAFRRHRVSILRVAVRERAAECSRIPKNPGRLSNLTLFKQPISFYFSLSFLLIHYILRVRSKKRF